MTDFSTIDITEAKKLLSQKKITATELTEFFIKQIEEMENNLQDLSWKEILKDL